MPKFHPVRRFLIRRLANAADTGYWIFWQSKALGLRVRRLLGGKRPMLLTDPDRVDAEKPVVIPLAGFATSWEFLTPLITGLSNHGFSVAVIPQLGTNVRSVDVLTTRVQRFLASHRELWPVVFVSHSKGGLVAKSVLLADVENECTVGAVTLAAPFAGAMAARLVRGGVLRSEVGREIVRLQPGAPRLLELEQQMDANHRIASIVPVYDEIIGVRGRVQGGRNRAVSSLGHNRLISDPRVHAVVVHEINRLWNERRESVQRGSGQRDSGQRESGQPESGQRDSVPSPPTRATRV